MKDLKTNIQIEERATRWMWDTTNSNSGNTGVVYKYKITNDGFDLDAEVDKFDIQPFGENGELFDKPTSSIYQESKVRDFKTDRYPTLIIEKYKADKMLAKGQGHLYSNFCKDAVVTFRVTDKLIRNSEKTKMWLPKTSSIGLNNEKELTDVYLLPIKFGNKLTYSTFK